MDYTKRISVITSLYRCRSYLNGYFDAVNQIKNRDECEFLLIHNDPEEEEVRQIQERMKETDCFRYISVNERETLYASWNRGISLATGKYLCVWNVDDIRFPESVKRQADSLDCYPEVMMTYGDVLLLPYSGAKEGKRLNTYSFEGNRSLFTERHQVGCFPMWRRSVHEEIGYFDEQFWLAGDFEFQVRCALHFPLVKTEGLLGSYLNGGEGRLSQLSQIQQTERCCIEMRYAIYHKINPFYLFSALKFYSLSRISSYSHFVSVFPLVPKRFHVKRIPLFVGLLARLPLHIGRYLKHVVLKRITG